MHHSRLTGFPACSTKSEFSCGVGVPPAHERLIENGARSQRYERLNMPVIETSIDKAWGFLTYFFHTLIKQRQILEWPRSSCHTDSCDVSPSPVRSTHFTRD
ncbi:MAG: hypothetical protein EAZ88_07780 [Oscillatoriales cyanobacterium]|nr:MAG: hypothetical protein EAZ88_07780 [Oscillatoriales cyanobacterium]